MAQRVMAQRAVASRGFTLVELVVVIVVMGILAFGTVSFITSSSQNYQRASVGDRLGTSARILVDKLSRELRAALPNSVRASADGRCLEWVPSVAAGTYLELAQGLETTMPVLPLFEPPAWTASNARVSVYPLTAEQIYAAGGPPTITNAAADLALSASNAATSAAPVALSFVSAPDFGFDSPQRRFYLVDNPISYCTDNGRLYRYQGYPFSDSQPVLPPLVTPQQGRWLVSDRIYPPADCGGSGEIFAVTPATLQRNAIVQIDLCLTQPQGGRLQVVHEVQLRNVP